MVSYKTDNAIRLEHPVINSTLSMDDRKGVPIAPTIASGPQLQNRNDTSVGGSVSGVIRRRNGLQQGLRSPAAKRPFSAPVTLQGWLYKQGSEGLMLWKKRWFVLTEYCIFYYKGPEEEKLLGSILLPSYKVTICEPEEKVNKKFAFKAEHANMRTYFFAAETREGMNQWVNVLTLATFLQDPTPGTGQIRMAVDLPKQAAHGQHNARPSVSSMSSVLNNSTDDSDSGFHGFQSRDDPSNVSKNNPSSNSSNITLAACLSSNNSSMAVRANEYTKHDSSEHIPEERDKQETFTNGWIKPPGQFGYQDLRQRQHYDQLLRNQGQQHHHQQQQQQQFFRQQQIDAHKLIANYQQTKIHQQIKQSQHVKLRQHQHQSGLSNVQSIEPGIQKFGHRVYANAPPKPRRFADDSIDYSTSLPDMDPRILQAIPSNPTMMKNSMVEHERGKAIDASRLTHQQPQVTLRTDKSGLNYGYSQGQPAERRTPDTYGRSAKPRILAGDEDYEDVYTGSQLYKRPVGPVGYTKSPVPVPIPVPMYNDHQQNRQPACFPGSSSNLPGVKASRSKRPARPHSADFLDYETTGRPQLPNDSENSLTIQKRRPQRPKSSLDVVNASDALHIQDGSFISDERDATQMRQSVVYRKHNPQERQHVANESLSPDRTSVESYSLRVPDVDNNNSVSATETPCQELREPRSDHCHEQHRINMQSLQRYSNGFRNDAMMRRSLRETNYDPSSSRDSLIRGETSTVRSRISRDSHLVGTGVRNTEDGYASPGSRHPGNVETRHWREQQLARSASARLPRMKHFNDRTEGNEYSERNSTQSSQDGERRIQQREESMKRLIEWKQRMLHSPLTRKPPTALVTGGATTQTEMSSYYKRQALLDLAAHEAMVAEARHSRRRDDGHNRPHMRSKSTDSQRSAVTNVSRYNSYSSDDEERDEVRRKRGRKHLHGSRNSRHLVEETPMAATSGRTISSHDVTGIGQANSSNARANCHHQVTFLSQRSSPRPTSSDNSHNSSGSLRHPTGIILPGSAYEEINFPQTCKKAYTISVSSNKQAGPMFTTTGETLSVKTPKKPSGILKSPTNYSTNQQQTKNESESLSISSDCTSGDNTWQSQKNVQFDPADERQNWYTKIDESKVIKEFSYQYIKPDERTDMRVEFDDQTNSQEAKNLVQSRIRSFESSIDGSSPVRQIASMQEPLKVSTCPATDAHVSRLDFTRKNSPNNHELTLQEGTEDLKKLPDIKSDEDTHNYSEQILDNGKTVKDLLADFEKKTQQTKRKEDDKNDEVTHRRVFSDTETLLYETESDLDQRDRSENEEDLYQTISKRCEDNENHTGTIKKNQSISSDKQNQKRCSTGISAGNSSVIDDFYGLSNSEAFSRLGMTESTSTHGIDYSDDITIPNADSDIENINVEEHYLPMTPRKAILDPNNDDRPNPKIMESLFANLRGEESSYVEMAQNGMRHSLLAPNDDGEERESGDYSTLDTRHYEFVRVTDMVIEPVYMEVNQLSDKVGKGKIGMDTDNHEDCSRKNSGNQVQSDLTDILVPRKSDSSDADDESSKDLDSIDAPRHPRFSLSDTFRPASYYLGASRVMIAELQDSSDSDLVSPPPIPSSPPPLEELDSLNIHDSFEEKQAQPQVVVARENLSVRSSPKSWNAQIGQFDNHISSSRFSECGTSLTCHESRISIESTTESEQCELRNSDDEERHRQQLKRRPVSNEVCEVLASLDEFESLGNRFASTGIDLDEYLEELQARDAFNVDIYAKDLSYNSIYGFNENRMVTDKLQKPSGLEIVAKMNLNSNNSLDRPFQYDCRGKAGSASSLPSMKVSDAPPSHQHSQSFTGDAHYENLAANSSLRGSPAVNSESETMKINCRTLMNPEYNSHKIAHGRGSSCSLMTRGTSGLISSSYDQRNRTLPGSMGSSVNSSSHTHNFDGHQSHVRSSSHDSPRSVMTLNYRPSSCQDPTFYTESPLTPTQQAQISSAGFQNFEGITAAQHPQNCIERDQTSAPYYYSDLQINPNNVDGHNNFFIGHTSRLPQLNNQRADSSLCLNKRNDIGRLVNQITHQIPREIENEDIDESRLIAAALRMSSSQYFVEKRSGQVDRKNVYESDTLRRSKSTEPMPNEVLPDVNTVNLYPLGLRNKSNSQTNLAPGNISPELEQPTQSSHRRSRSLEGLLNNVELQNLVEQRKRANDLSSVPSTSNQEYEESPELAAAGVSNFGTGSVEDSTGFDGEDPWEQDTLWRESLRRVSLRHARSLDNLDNSPRSMEIVLDSSKTRPKITRGATYVNDSVILQKHQRHASPEERAKRRSKERNPESGERNEEPEVENSYELLATNHRLAGDYIWDPDNEAYRRQSSTSQHNQNHNIKSENHFLSEENLPPVASVEGKSRMSASTSASFELDREKLRQWDLVSSACLLQEQQRTSMAESARGLPMFEDQRRHGQSIETGENTKKVIVMNETSMEIKKRRNDPRRGEDIGPFEENDDRKQSGTSSSGRQSKSIFDMDAKENEMEEDK